MELREIWSTPGYFYSIAYALAAFIVVSMQPGGLKGRGRWLLHGGVLVFLMALMDLTRGAYGALFVLMETTVAATLFFSVWYTVRDGAKACFLGAKAFIYGETMASLTWMVYYFLGTRYPALQNGWAMAGISLVTAAAIAVLLYAMEGAFDGEALELEITRRDALIVLITAASVYVVSNLGYLDSDGIFGGQYAREIFTSRTLVDISGAAMLHAYTVQLREVQHRLERDALHNIMENQYQAYLNSRESMELVNQKYHDLKHQIALMQAQADSPKAREYLENMRREIQSYEAQNQTGHPVLDAMLSVKGLYCQNHGIELKVIADGALLSFMEDMEISALFGNMLDNAIESVERIADPQRRLIRLYVDREHGFLRIRLENYCEEDVRFKDGMPVTTKRDRRFHGFGMKSMQRTVSKYGGSIVAAREGNWFALRILIPLMET